MSRVIRFSRGKTNSRPLGLEKAKDPAAEEDGTFPAIETHDSSHPAGTGERSHRASGGPVSKPPRTTRLRHPQKIGWRTAHPGCEDLEPRCSESQIQIGNIRRMVGLYFPKTKDVHYRSEIWVPPTSPHEEEQEPHVLRVRPGSLQIPGSADGDRNIPLRFSEDNAAPHETPQVPRRQSAQLPRRLPRGRGSFPSTEVVQRPPSDDRKQQDRAFKGKGPRPRLPHRFQFHAHFHPNRKNSGNSNTNTANSPSKDAPPPLGKIGRQTSFNQSRRQFSTQTISTISMGRKNRCPMDHSDQTPVEPRKEAQVIRKQQGMARKKLSTDRILEYLRRCLDLGIRRLAPGKGSQMESESTKEGAHQSDGGQSDLLSPSDMGQRSLWKAFDGVDRLRSRSIHTCKAMLQICRSRQSDSRTFSGSRETTLHHGVQANPFGRKLGSGFIISKPRNSDTTMETQPQDHPTPDPLVASQREPRRIAHRSSLDRSNLVASCSRLLQGFPPHKRATEQLPALRKGASRFFAQLQMETGIDCIAPPAELTKSLQYNKHLMRDLSLWRLKKRLSPSSWRTYATSLHTYIQSCKSLGIAAFSPVQEKADAAALWAAYWKHVQGTDASTAQVLSAVRLAYSFLNWPGPSRPTVKEINSIAKRSISGPTRQMDPLLASQVAKWYKNTPPEWTPSLKIHWSPVMSFRDDITLILSMMLLGFTRASEAAKVDWKDIRFLTDTTVWSLKPDKTFKVTRVSIKDGKHIPILSLLNRFRRASNSPQLGRVFRDSRSQCLNTAKITSMVRQVVADLGLSGNFASHSMRRGAATSALHAGWSQYQIQLAGRWQSSAFLQYLRLDERMSIVDKLGL